MTAVRGSNRVTDQNPEAKYQALEKYGIDLVERAHAGKLDPVIGRDDETGESSKCSHAVPRTIRY
ncbi:MAG: hypothetical protein R3B96_07715 [Pirellulaceae bacterium]